jgi:hypothetical protein
VSYSSYNNKINVTCSMKERWKSIIFFWWLFGLWCLTPHSTIFQLYHGGSVLLVEETGVPRKNPWPVASHCTTLNPIMLYRVQLTKNRAQLTPLVVIGTDCTGSWKSNYYTITTTTAPHFLLNLNKNKDKRKKFKSISV